MRTKTNLSNRLPIEGWRIHSQYIGSILPGNPPQPCPELLTENEAIRYLRLDEIDIDDPASTLRYYRKKGILRATQVGKCIRYRRIELDAFLERLTDSNPR